MRTWRTAIEVITVIGLKPRHTDFASLFQHDDTNFITFFTLKLFYADGSTEASWPASNDAYIDLIFGSFDGCGVE
jgi:hypothetical protein